MIAENSIVSKAIQAAGEAKLAYCKFLSANDSGETGGHQAGILISKKALPMLFDVDRELSHIEKRTARIIWQDNYTTDSVFTYYQSKNELRITSFGRKFPYLNKEDTGALFVFTQVEKDFYKAYFLYTEDEIEEFLGNIGISPTETNSLIGSARKSFGTLQECDLISKFIDSQRDATGTIVFPDSITMSRAAREIENKVYNHSYLIKTNPDKKLLDWTSQEFRLFRQIEYISYFIVLHNGFTDMDSFIEVANQVLNRRKSRAGKSLEHHLSALFDGNRIAYEEQVRTEGNKRPDFIFPSGIAYHNISFPTDKLVSLASKTTCKDRWRQVINEADRLRDRNKYLLTLQQGISTQQLDEMAAEKVILVVPKPYISSYPKERQETIWTIKQFIDFVKEKQNSV